MLELYFKFDNDYNDYSGNARHGTNTLMTLGTGAVNNSVYNNSGQINAYVEANYVNTFTKTDIFTISAKVYVSSAWDFATKDGQTYFVCNGAQYGGSFGLGVDSDGKIIAFMRDTNNVMSSVKHTTLITDSWIHAIMIWDGTTKTLTLQIDNTIVGTANPTFTGDFNVTTKWVIGGGNIGNGNQINKYFEGGIDEVRVYSSEIKPLQRDRLLNFLGRNEVVVNGKDFSEYLVNLKIEEIFAKVGKYTVSFLDSTLSQVSSISYGQTVEIYSDGVKKFKGIIFDKPKETKTGITTFLIRSKIIFLLDGFISVNYTNKTIDYIIKNIIDTYFSGIFTYTNVSTRVITYNNIVYNGQSPWFIFQDLAKREDLQIWVDENDDLHLTDLLSVDSGKHFNLDTGVLVKTYDFPDISQTIKNSILVYSKQKTPDGKGGIAVRYNNFDSIVSYGRKIEHPPVTLNDIETEEECFSRGKEIIDEIAFSLQDGTFATIYDIDLYPGQLITISYSKKGWSQKQFLVKSVVHTIRPKFSTVKIAEVDRTTLDLLVSVFNALRKNEERFRDSTAIISNVVQIFEKINIQLKMSVVRVIAGSRTYRTNTKFNKFSMIAGSAIEQTVVNDEKMVLTNAGKKKILDILTGTSAIDITSANMWGGLGTGTTPAAVTDTDLETAVDINSDVNTIRQDMDSGFPARIDDYNIEMQFSVLDADVNQQAFNEIALFDASTGGIMYTRQVASTAFNKNPNETLRVKVQMEVVDA